MKIGKKLGINPQAWGHLTEAQFISKFKGKASLPELKEAYKKIPKIKKAKEVGRIQADQSTK